MGAPEHIEQRVVGNPGRIVLDLDDLGMAGILPADLLVGRALGPPASIAPESLCYPSTHRKVASMPQKQPAPNVAFSI